MNIEWNKAVSTIHQTVAKISDEIMPIYEAAQFDITLKDDNTPLTIADKISHEHIIRALKTIDPETAIISEEMDFESYNFKEKPSKYWVIDPIDGTKGFVNKTGEFTINIGLIQENEVFAGFVYVPVKKLFYYAKRNSGAWLVDEHNNKSQVHCRTRPDEASKYVIVRSRSYYDKKTAAWIEQFDKNQHWILGSTLKFLALAEGKADLYPRFSRINEWDIAAPHCILIEAGGTLLSLETKEPLTYDRQDLKVSPFVGMALPINRQIVESLII